MNKKMNSNVNINNAINVLLNTIANEGNLGRVESITIELPSEIGVNSNEDLDFKKIIELKVCHNWVWDPIRRTFICKG